MARLELQSLLKAGAHFGHISRRWNSNMRPYVFMEKNGIHIIDLKKTIQLAEEAFNSVQNIVGKGKKVLFVGTKKQAKHIIEEQAKRCGMPYVSERWLGGMLTNFATIRLSVRRLNAIRKRRTEETYSLVTKKERLMIDREEKKLVHVLGGVEDMTRIPSAIFIADIKRESIAVKESHILGVPIFAIVDTNCDPTEVTYPIPANDDSIRSVELIASAFADSIIDATSLSKEGDIGQEKSEEKTTEPQNKSS